MKPENTLNGSLSTVTEEEITYTTFFFTLWYAYQVVVLFARDYPLLVLRVSL